MMNFTRPQGLYYISWIEWVAMGEQRSAVGFLAEWLETSPRTNRSILVNRTSSDIEQKTLPGLLACCPEARTGYLDQTVSIAANHSVIALFPEKNVAEGIIDHVDAESVDLCLVLWPGFDQLEMWLEAHGAFQLPSGVVADSSFLGRLNPVVRVALKHSVEAVNEQGRLEHGRGKDEIVQILLLLHREGYIDDKYDLQRYAYQLGYRQRDVEHIGRYVDIIQAGCNISTGPNRLGPDTLQHWKTKAQES